jgi:hypothetical protein
MFPARFMRTVLTVFFGLAVFVPGVASGRAIGLPTDTMPPQINHTPMTNIVEGMPVRIQATVTDNDEVSAVILNYRHEGDGNYLKAQMAEAAGSDIYSVDLPNNFGPRVEYFIEANDKSGNNATGEVYEIAVPVMSAMQSNVVPFDSGEPGLNLQPAKRGMSKWVWIGLGALAVGAIASGIGGGSGGGDVATNTGANTGTGNSGAGVGTVTINAPVPQP